MYSFPALTCPIFDYLSSSPKVKYNKRIHCSCIAVTCHKGRGHVINCAERTFSTTMVRRRPRFSQHLTGLCTVFAVVLAPGLATQSYLGQQALNDILGRAAPIAGNISGVIFASFRAFIPNSIKVSTKVAQ